MLTSNLRYQPVICSDGTVKLLETIIDDEGQTKAATYEPVCLEAASIGEIEALLREVYRDLRKVKPITEEELEATLYGSMDIAVDEDEDNKVIDLISYFADPSLLKSS